MILEPALVKKLRIAGLALAIAGSSVMAVAVARFILAVARNDIAGGRRLTRIPEYYVQVGAHYARGFTTGFFLCYFLMLFAMIAGSWVDEILKRRRRAAQPQGGVTARD